MANGSDILIAAEALEAEGHFGPASRLYEEARRLFEAARVGDAAFWTAVRRREECRELAKERGENPDVAMQVQLQLIRANPERFVREYYHGVAGSCIKRLRETAAEGRYQDLLSLAYRMTRYRFVQGPLQHELPSMCATSRVAQNRLGAHGERWRIQTCSWYSGHFADGVPRNARAGLCYGLGEAQFHTGANPEEALGEAITHYVALAADAESPPELVADANERRANAAVWLIAYYGWRPPRYPVQLQYALELADTALPLLQDAERLDELLTAVENLQRCFANIEPKQRCQMGDTAGRIIALAHEWMTRLGDARGVGRLGLVAVQTAESLGDYPLVIRLAQALAEDPAVRYDAESLAAWGGGSSGGDARRSTRCWTRRSCWRRKRGTRRRTRWLRGRRAPRMPSPISCCGSASTSSARSWTSATPRDCRGTRGQSANGPCPASSDRPMSGSSGCARLNRPTQRSSRSSSK